MPKLVPLLVVLLAPLLAASAPPSGEAQIRDAFARWTDDFNAGRADAVCDLFAKDLVAKPTGAGGSFATSPSTSDLASRR